MVRWFHCFNIHVRISTPLTTHCRLLNLGLFINNNKKFANWKIVISEHRTNKRGFYVVLLLPIRSIVETLHKNKNGLPTEAKIVKDQPFTVYSILSLSYLSFYKWQDVLHWTLQVKDELLQVYIFTSEPGQMLFMDSPLEYSFGYELWIWYIFTFLLTIF